MPLIVQAFVFAFGAVIGSFLNAVLWRLAHGVSIARGRSACPNCRHALSPRDLVPIVSYLALRGHCRYCHARIASSYLAVETACGTLFLLFARKAFAESPAVDPAGFARLLIDWYAAAVLVLVFMYDHRHMVILRSVTVPATIIAFVGNFLLGMDPAQLAAGTVIGAGFFWLQHALSRGRWIGTGDIYLGALMGAILGFPMIVLAIFLAYVSGALIGIALLASRAKGLQSQIPFGTFLSAATVVTMLWGRQFLGWYLGML